MSSYLEFKNRKEKEINNFPMMFAFTEQQFKEGMEKLGLNQDDTDKIYSIGLGGYIRKSDSEALDQLFEKFEKEFREKINNDTTGEGFIFDMFNYELGNHEYIITGSVDDTLDALGLTREEIDNNPKLLKGLKMASKAQRKYYENNKQIK